MSPQPDPVNRTLEQFRAYLECLTFITIDPRLRRRFGFSDLIQKTLVEAWHTLGRIEALEPEAQKRWLRRMLVHNLLEQIDKEKAALFEDWGKFRDATKAWLDLMGKLQPEVTKKPKAKEQYYEAYYSYVFCLYKYAQGLDDPKKKTENMTRAGKAIAKLEETQADFGGVGMKEKYMQLLDKEPPLKKEYLAAKAAGAKAVNANPK